MDALGISCSWTGAKWHAPHSFGSHWCSQEGDSDDWATQGLHINYPGVCPTEVTPASLFSVSTQHGRLVDTGYKSNLHRQRGGCRRQSLTVGEAIIVHWSPTLYCPSQARPVTCRCWPARICLPLCTPQPHQMLQHHHRLTTMHKICLARCLPCVWHVIIHPIKIKTNVNRKDSLITWRFYSS